MGTAFEKTRINGLELRNRFVRSATWEGMASPDGACTPRLIDLYRELALGGVGLIITSHAYVEKQGQAGPWQLGIYGDELVEGLSRLAEAVHGQGGRIVAQLAHAGCFAAVKLTGQAARALSAAAAPEGTAVEELTADGIEALTAVFAEAGRRAREAGFDGVQIHAAHGYLLSQSLSPRFNRRSDAFGGPVGNRARFLLKVLRALRQRLGEDFPILVKMNCGDFLEGGLELEDSLEVARLLEKEGIDAIELSGGTFLSGPLNPSRTKVRSEEQEAYFREAARTFKREIGVPLILVGGIRSPKTRREAACRRMGGLLFHEPPPDPGAPAHQTLAGGRSAPGGLRFRQPVLRAGPGRGGDLLRHGRERAAGIGGESSHAERVSDDQGRDERRDRGAHHRQPAGKPDVAPNGGGLQGGRNGGLRGPGGQGPGDHRNREEFYRRRGHHPAAAGQEPRGRPAAHPGGGQVPQQHRDRTQARGRRHQRQLPGRRAGNGHGLPLPAGGQRGQPGAARGADRGHSRGRRHAAAAAPDRSAERPGDDHRRPAGQGRGRPSQGSGGRSDRARPAAGSGVEGRPAVPQRRAHAADAHDPQRDPPAAERGREDGPGGVRQVHRGPEGQGLHRAP